jgi:hypothetical protein
VTKLKGVKKVQEKRKGYKEVGKLAGFFMVFINFGLRLVYVIPLYNRFEFNYSEHY